MCALELSISFLSDNTGMGEEVRRPFPSSCLKAVTSAVTYANLNLQFFTVYLLELEG